MPTTAGQPIFKKYRENEAYVTRVKLGAIGLVDE